MWVFLSGLITSIQVLSRDMGYVSSSGIFQAAPVLCPLLLLWIWDGEID